MTLRAVFFAGLLVANLFFIPQNVYAGGTVLADDENQEPNIRIKLGRKIMTLPLDTYLAGVIGHEMSPRWPLEALKAQTVAARSYALSRMEAARDKGRDYDVVTTQADQVFHPKTSKNPFLLDVVSQTRGEVLFMRDRVVQAYFSSTCGGRMETAEGACLAQTDLLTKGGKDSFCSISPFRHWVVASSISELESRMLKKKIPVSGLKSVKVKKRNKTGYVNSVSYTDADGRHELTGRDFRYLLGSMRVKSQLFNLDQESDGSVMIHGNGFGHGVGLCQYGAKSMALKKYRYKRILAKYYPRTTLKKIY